MGVTERFACDHELAFVVVLALLLALFMYARAVIPLARDGLTRFKDNCLIAFLAGDATYLLLDFLLRINHVTAIWLSIGAAMFVLWWKSSAPRSRYIASSTKRAAIAQFERKGGKYDSSKHHFDHIWPFSRGGSHSLENVRIIEKRMNLRKGARNPRFRDLYSNYRTVLFGIVVMASLFEYALTYKNCQRGWWDSIGYLYFR